MEPVYAPTAADDTPVDEPVAEKVIRRVLYRYTDGPCTNRPQDRGDEELASFTDDYRDHTSDLEPSTLSLFRNGPLY